MDDVTLTPPLDDVTLTPPLTKGRDAGDNGQGKRGRIIFSGSDSCIPTLALNFYVFGGQYAQ